MSVKLPRVANCFWGLLSDGGRRAIVKLAILLRVKNVLRKTMLRMAVTSKRCPSIGLRFWTRRLRERKIQSSRGRRKLQQAVSGQDQSGAKNCSPNQDSLHDALELEIYHQLRSFEGSSLHPEM